MPNTTSAKKAARRAERRRIINKPRRTVMRSAVKDARTALAGKGDATASVEHAISALDRAVTKGVLHRNAAARRKSRLMRQLNKSKAA